MLNPALKSKEAEKPQFPKIGPYRLIEEIGEGGFGIVYLADQLEPVDRQVALKMIKPGLDSRKIVARFEAERQVLALLDHPNIATIFDGGMNEAGRSYLVMELVDGISVTQYCEGRNLELAARLEIFLDICRGVQHAHQKGVIHRDLKPSNVLVTTIDEQAVPKVIDFGIAKVLSQQVSGGTLLTEGGQIVGTPEYMSPEQATQESADVDTRSDIYSLGALLYELVTGKPPLEYAKLRTASAEEVQRLICDKTPTRPSSHTGGGQWRSPSSDLDWIILKALEKDPNRRYQSVLSLMTDIGRFLRHEVIEARPPSPGYILRRFAQRNRVAILISVTTLVFLLGALAFNISQAVRAREAEKVAREAGDEAKRAESEMRRKVVRLNILNGTRSLENGDPWAALLWFRQAWKRDEDLSRTEHSHRLRIAGVLAGVPKIEGLATHAGEIEHASFNTSGDRLLTSTKGHSEVFLWDILRGVQVVKPLRHEGAISHVAFDSTGERIVSSGLDSLVKLWRASSGELIGEPLSHPGSVRWSGFSPDGGQLVTACDDGLVRVWDVGGDRGKVIAELKVSGKAEFAEFSPDGKLIVAMDGREMAIAWSYPELKPSGKFPHLMRPRNDEDQLFLVPQFDPDGSRLLTATEDEFVLNNLDGSGRTVRAQSPFEINSVGIDKEMKHALVVGRSTGAILVDFESNESAGKFSHPREVQAGAVSAEGSHLATSSSIGMVHVWDRESREELVPVLRHLDFTPVLQFMESRLLVAGWDGTARLWNFEENQFKPRPYGNDCGRADRLKTSIKKLELLEVRSKLSGDGKRQLTYNVGTPRARVGWIGATGNEEKSPLEIKHVEPLINDTRLSSDGSRVLLVGENLARVYDSTSGEAVGPIIEFGGKPRYSKFAENGSSFVLNHGDRTVSSWDSESGSLLFRAGPKRGEGDPERFVLTDREISSVRLSPNGRYTALEEEGTSAFIHIVDHQTARAVRARNRSGFVHSMEFGDEGRLLAFGSSNRTAQVVNSVTGEVLGPRLRHDSFVRDIAFSPDGTMLATIMTSGSVSIWDWRTGDMLLTGMEHSGGSVTDIWFSKDGKQLITRFGDKIYAWPLPSFDLQEDKVDDFLELMTGQIIDANDGLEILPRTRFREAPERYLDAWRSWRESE